MVMSISVVVPAYNRCHLLARAIDSVVKQTIPVEEIILVDNASTDGTRKFIQNHYPNVKYVLEPKKGVSFARNRGIRAAQGNWIALLDSDDCWHKKKIETFLKFQSQSNFLTRIWHSDEVWVRNGNNLNQKFKVLG